VGAQYGAKVSTDYRAVLDDPAVQLVSVCTSSATHREIAIAAMGAGKGVVCEKTLADSPESAADIARAADATGQFCATAYMKRFFPASQRAKELLAGMGQLISVYARSWQPWDMWNAPLDDSLRQHPSWMVRNYGGGALVMAGSHILDLVHWLVGRPAEVVGHLNIREGMDADRQGNAMLWMPDGSIVHYEACGHPYKFVGYERNGWDERLEINTVTGRLDLYTVTWNRPDRNGALLVHMDGETGVTTEYRYPQVNPFHLEMASMLQWFERGETPAPSAWDGYVVDELIAHVTRSSRERQRLAVAYQDRVAAK
ncbi:MAG TPA: Gfo/Idh/MocA family oxidoreductase, partial [Armatimonadota bacterium]|nr:Gfo/Idh/MocA family oxidoreductase [Armatimonadota bacterium]